MGFIDHTSGEGNGDGDGVCNWCCSMSLLVLFFVFFSKKKTKGKERKAIFGLVES